MAPSSTVKVVSDTVTAAVSSSVTVTDTDTAAASSYSSALRPGITSWVTAAASSSLSLSCRAHIRTVFGVSQLSGAKVISLGVRFTSELPLIVSDSTTSPVGGAFSFTV